LKYFLVALSALMAVPCWSQTTTGKATTSGPCSPAVSGNNNQFTIKCPGINEEKGKRMLEILNKILANELDPEQVMAKLDEILKAVGTGSPIQNCPNGNCIGRDNNGLAVVNNYGLPLPNVTWTVVPMVDLGKPTTHPAVCLKMNIDKMFADPKFAVFCDRPCKSVGDELNVRGGGYIQTEWGIIPDHPDVAGFVIDQPNPLPASSEFTACVESQDDEPVRILSVKTLTTKPQ